jgi:hypothetical protein
MADKNPNESSSPPWHVWFAFLIVAVLRMLPFLSTRLSHDPRVGYLPLGYLPKDFLAYVSIIRETSHTGSILFENPFTIEPQSGRFILLFHALLGQISAWTHLDPFWTLELSRIPLLAIFAFVFWRFITPILLDIRHRVWACWLVALSGGLEFIIRPLFVMLPPTISQPSRQDLSHLVGWNTFQSFFNPLWIAALILLLLTLMPLLKPGGPSTWKDKLQSALSFFLLYFTHPYTGIAALPILAVYFCLRLIFRDGAVLREMLRTAAVLIPPLILIALITAWQNQDAVFRQSSGNAFGPQNLPAFWYPIGYGVLCIFLALGWQRFTHEKHPWRFALGGWTIAIALLHSSPLINGYKFLFLLHIPVCIVAAPVLADAFTSLWLNKKPLALALAVLLFASNLDLSYRCLDEVQAVYPDGSLVNPNYLAVAQTLSTAPDGPVLASPGLGNLIPAYAPQHVYVGQWFMTPDFMEKSHDYEQLLACLESQDDSTQLASDVRQFVSRNTFRYVIIPTRVAPRAASFFRDSLAKKSEVGVLTILELKLNSESH